MDAGRQRRAYRFRSVLRKKGREYGALYPPGLITKQYDRRVGFTASCLIVVAWIGVTAGQILAAGKILSAMESAVLSCGWWSSASSLSDIPCSAAQYANIRTDVLDVVIVFVGIFTGLGVLLWQMGGINGLINALPADKLSFPLSSNFGGSDLVSYLLLVGLTYVVGPDMYSRLFCARDGRTAKISVFWAALFLIPIALAITLIGMGAFALQPDILPEQAFPVLITGILPTLAAGVVLAALVSAIMSTADATLLSAGTILSMDIIGHFRKSDNQQLSLRHSQIAILLIGLASLGLALMLKGLLRPYYSPTPSIPAG